MKKIQIKGIWYSILGVILASIYPLMLLWMANFNQVTDPADLFKTMGLLVACAIALLAVLTLIIHDVRRAAVATILTTVIFENGALLQNLFTAVIPSLRYWHTATLLAVLIGVAIYAALKLSQQFISYAAPIITLVFGVLVTMNIAMAIPYMARGMMDASEPPTGQATMAPATNVSGRNAYWLLFDEYSSNYEFAEYFGYDNTPFTDYLEDKGFSVSYTSENEYDRTAVITANIANLDYVAAYSDERTLIEDWALILEHRKTAKLVPLLEAHDYEIVGIGSADYYGYNGETVGEQTGTGLTANGDDMLSLFWERTVIAPFMEKDVNSQALLVLSQLEYLQDPENIPNGNTFVLSHIVCPHTPFLFDETGNLIPSSGRKDAKNYIGQCKYLNTHIERIVENILEHDPDAVIAVMSDHGHRGGIPYDVRRRIFAALYNGSQGKIDIEGMSGLNIMITMLNSILDTDMELVSPILLEEVQLH